MFFDTIDEYNNELCDIKNRMDSMEKRIEKYPDRPWIEGNYLCLKEIYDVIRQDKDTFLKMRDENINLHIYDDNVKEHKISLSTVRGLFDNFHDLTSFLSDFLKSNLNFTFEGHDLILDKISKGSIQVLFSMDEDITDLNEVYLNHQVFTKLLDLVECDVEDLEKQKEIIGADSIAAYKKFLKIIIDNGLDFTLENNSRKVGLTHEEAKMVYDEL